MASKSLWINNRHPTPDTRHPSRSASKSLWIPLAVLSASILTGCGGGGGSSGTSATPTAKSQVRQRVIACARLTRAALAIVGLGKMITRTAGGRRPRLISLLLPAFHHTRDVVQGYDGDTQLYYTLTFNADGSGRMDLSTDAAHAKPAGNFVWGVPQWNHSQPNSYPAAIHVSFQITAGEFTGDHGTIDMTVMDPAGNNETLHLTLTDALGETSVTDFNVVNGKISGTDHITLSDGTLCSGTIEDLVNDVIQIVVAFPDDSQETLDDNSDGTITQTYDSNGTQDASGTIDDSGNDSIDYSDGSSETVNVDTGGSTDNSSSSDSSGSSSDSSGS